MNNQRMLLRPNDWSESEQYEIVKNNSVPDLLRPAADTSGENSASD